MKKAIIITGVLLALGGIVTASIVQSGRDGNGEKVYVKAVERRAISQVVKASGQVDPRVKVNVSAHVVAKIEELHVAEGQEIEKGAPFLRLEQATFLAARDRARAQLEIARSSLDQARIDLADAELKQRRYERLAREEIATAEQLESVELAAKSAALRVDQAREAVLQAEADLGKAEDDLAKTVIHSPLTGRVIVLNAEEGEVVVSGTMHNAASVIGVVADLSEILVEVDVDETDIVDVAVGQQATILVDAIPDHEYAGRVVEIGSSGFNRPQQPDVTFFKVKVLFEEPDVRLRPGMSARADIEVATHQDALVVPIQVVVYRKPVVEDGETAAAGEEEVKVAFVARDGEATQVPVEVGIADATHAEIVAGLEEGDEVVTGPHRTLKDLEHGDAIRPEAEGEGDEAEEG